MPSSEAAKCMTSFLRPSRSGPQRVAWSDLGGFHLLAPLVGGEADHLAIWSLRHMTRFATEVRKRDDFRLPLSLISTGAECRQCLIFTGSSRAPECCEFSPRLEA
jgi:hypothetical protein